MVTEMPPVLMTRNLPATAALANAML